MDDLILPSKNNNLICPTKKLASPLNDGGSATYSSGDRSFTYSNINNDSNL